MHLTDAQTNAVLHAGRNLQIIACAGSGKTEVVARRVAHLLTRNNDDRLKPRNIVAFTFTDKAAAELKERVLRRMKEATGSEITGAAEMYIGTIHGFCQELLRNELPKYLKYEVLDPVRQILYVDRYSKKTGLTTSTKLNGQHLRRWIDTDLYLTALAVLREDFIDHDQLRSCSVSNGLQLYRDQLSNDAYFDFSAMLEESVNELTRNETIIKSTSERVKYVIVDEYQDVNPIQERLIQRLHELGASLCVVGDDDQTIYQWRGSSVDNIVTFHRRYPDVGQVRLEENFRSSEGVIETANQFVDSIPDRLQKRMRFADAHVFERGDVVAVSFESPEQEAMYIANTIKSLYGTAFSDGDGKRGLSWSDMAILLRSVRHNGAVITDVLRRAGVPFIVSGLQNLFETEEARSARAVFHYIADETIYKRPKEVRPPSEMEIYKLWSNSRFGINVEDVRAAVRYATWIREELQKDGKGIPSIQAVYLRFLKELALREESCPGGIGQVVLFNLGKFSQVITDWESVHYRSSKLDSFTGFAKFLYYRAAGSYSEGDADVDFVTPDAVQVMTVHQAKGREWPAVFLPALVRNRFPSVTKKSTLWNLIPSEAVENADRYDGSLDDERRLFYVAMTRSQKYLSMTWAPVAGKNNWYVRPSIFWQEMRASKYVKRRVPDYSGLRRMTPTPRSHIANVEFSFSDLKYLYECGYQFKLRVLYGFDSPIVPPLGYGKSLHDALAEVHYRAMDGDYVSEDDVPDLVSRHLRTPYAGRELRSRLETAAGRDIRNYIRDNVERLRRVEFTERAIEIHLGDGVSIRGRIDLVRRTDTDETTIVDLKSNERSQRENVTELQLHTYALGYKELTGRDADHVEIYELSERKSAPRPVDEDFIHDVRQKTREAADALREMRLVPDPTISKCRQCEFSSLCGKSLADS